MYVLMYVCIYYQAGLYIPHIKTHLQQGHTMRRKSHRNICIHTCNTFNILITYSTGRHTCSKAIQCDENLIETSVYILVTCSTGIPCIYYHDYDYVPHRKTHLRQGHTICTPQEDTPEARPYNMYPTGRHT